MRENATAYSWCWGSNTGDTADRCSVTEDPSSDLGHLKMASDDAGSCRARSQERCHAGPEYARAAEPDAGIPGHVGPIKQLHSGTGYNLVIDTEGKIYGTREPYNPEAILQISARDVGELQIQGQCSKFYLAMDEKGKIYAEELVKLYKRKLENWREVLTHLNSVIKWEKPYYPGIVAGIVTVIFIMLWYFDPSVLTTLSIFGIIACILDYVVPILSASFFDSSKWTGARERKYEEICYELVTLFIRAKNMWESVRQIKETKPYIYFFSVLGSLIMTAWIGNLIDNLLLTYLIVLFGCLLPGIKSHAVVQQNISKAMAMIKGVTGGEAKKKN